MTMPLIGCVQLNSQADTLLNQVAIEQSIIDASGKKVHLLVLPENACAMGNQRALAKQFDALSQWYGSLAARYNLFILAGTLPCPYRPDGTPVTGNRVRQVSQLFAPDGKRLARYDKIHLFKAQVSDSTGSYDEGQTFEPGDTTVVAQCDIQNLMGEAFKNPESSDAISTTNHLTQSGLLSVGMMICFDLRFPALAQRLRQSGADILTAPAAFTYKTGEAHWELLLKARALDAQCLVVGAAQGGEHIYNNGSVRQTWGHSAITNANGNVVAQTHKTTTPNADKLDSTAPKHLLITTPFDSNAQRTWRQNMPIHHCHRLVG